MSGTDHHAVRIYDIHTMKCFIPQNESDYHEAGLTRVRYSPNANIFTSSSIDGSIKIYDGVTSNCISTISKAHSGSPVTSVEFSKDGKFILSTGLDSIGKLWDISSCTTIVEFKGATQKVYLI